MSSACVDQYVIAVSISTRRKLVFSVTFFRAMLIPVNQYYCLEHQLKVNDSIVQVKIILLCPVRNGWHFLWILILSKFNLRQKFLKYALIWFNAVWL